MDLIIQCYKKLRIDSLCDLRLEKINIFSNINFMLGTIYIFIYLVGIYRNLFILIFINNEILYLEVLTSIRALCLL